MSGGVVWSKAAALAVAPRRGWDGVPPRAPDPKACFKRLQTAFTANAAILDAGELHKDADVELMKRARAAYSGKPSASLDVETEAAAYALMALRIGPRDKLREGDFIGLWAAKMGPAFAMEALALSARCQLAFIERGAVAKVLALIGPQGKTPPLNPAFEHFRREEGQGYRALRNAVLLAGEGARPALEAKAEALREGLPPALRATLTLAVERADWVASDLDPVIASGAGDAWWTQRLWFFALVLLLPTLEEARATFDRLAPNFLSLATGLLPLRFDLVARFGPEAAPFLVALTEQMGRASKPKMRLFAEALALLVHPNAASSAVIPSPGT